MKRISTTNFKRADRVSDLIMEELSDIVRRRIRDPRIGPITVTGVRVTDDLKTARVFYVELGKDTSDPAVQKGLEQATSFMKRELGKRLKLRSVPDIIFTLDTSFAYGSRIDKLLSEIEKRGEDASDASKDQ